MADRDSDALLGRTALKGVDLQDGTADLAYWMVAAARGRGLCTDSVTTLPQWAFDEVGFHRIELEHSVRNRDPHGRRGCAGGVSHRPRLRVAWIKELRVIE